MERISIAELKPDLPGLDSKQIHGVVTLIWPYSSSARQFACLLGDPDFRRRRRDGQVRVRFSGSSARAIAGTGVGIGDEVVLSLRGVEFVRDSDVNTPGKSIDWELAYTQTLCSRVVRDGEEIADLDFVDIAPTPAPASPTKATPRASIESSHQWSSPAYLKRMRLSNGPVLAPQIDPFADDIEDGHAKKRRRRSYRDWNAWTYLARTPSPDKEDVDMDDSDRHDGSPIRPMLVPATPISPSKMLADADTDLPEEVDREHTPSEDDAQASLQDHHGEISSGSYQLIAEGTNDDFVRDASYYDLYAGPGEQPPAQKELALGSDTEPSTDEEDIDVEIQETPESVDVGFQHLPHIDAVELEEIPQSDNPAMSDPEEPIQPSSAEPASENIEQPSDSATVAPAIDYTVHSTEMQDTIEVERKEEHVPVVETWHQETREPSQLRDDPIVVDAAVDDAPRLVMPPPTLSLLQTDFQTPYVPSLLTPVGKEPSSPSLQPLDSSTLPMPSPFPGGRDGNVSSYLDYVSTPQQSRPHSIAGDIRQELPDDEADYILETSFYSSVSSSRAPAFHPTHESAFTDLRFTFGMDGAAFSRPQTSSGTEKGLEESTVSTGPVAVDVATDLDQAEKSLSKHADNLENEDSDSQEAHDFMKTFLASSPVEPHAAQPKEPTETVVLSSSSDVGDTDLDENPDADMVDDTHENHNESRLEKPVDDGPTIHIERSEEANIKTAEFTHDSDGERYHEVSKNDQVDQQVDEADLDDSTGATEAEFTHATSSEDMYASKMDTAPDPETQDSAVIAEVIDLGSPSDESDDDEASMHGVEVSNTGIISQGEHDEESDYAEGPITLENSPEDELKPGHKRFASQKHAEETVLPNGAQRDVATEHEEWQSEYIKLEPTEETEDHNIMTPDAEVLDTLPSDVASIHEDIKMESVEENLTTLVQQDDDQSGDDRSTVDEQSELLIAIPTEGHKVGELEFVTVPDAAPARSTRSKTKTTISPEKESNVSSQKVRSRKRGSIAPLSLSQKTAGPSATRSRSTITPTPTKESFSASPYSLRSQSKHLSPIKSAFASAKKHSRQRSTQTKSSAEPSPQQASFTQDSSAAEFDFPWTNFGPSQELGTLQGRHANVPYVKDSEEGSMHSEQSLSTVQYSEDWNMRNISSDTPLPDAQVRGPSSTPTKAHTASADPTSPVTPVQNAGTQVTRATRSVSKKSISPFATQLPLSSPTKSVRSVASIGVASGSPRRSRRINRDQTDAPADDDRDAEMRSSPPVSSQLDGNIVAGEIDGYKPLSPQAAGAKIASADQQSILPMTPEATQYTLAESQPSFPTVQEQSLPMTPQLTQSMSLRRGSFEAEETTLVQPPSISKTAPRRNATATDVASPSASPRPSAHSASEGEVDVAEAEKPSIGLSTPIAYYTPLKDLPYFLNRSSTFHSAGSPDILALVTTASTPPTRATKGPKHHTTNLHITDLSVYPSQTTVQIFRAYANALPTAEVGDVVLLRAFHVKSLNRHPCLVSADESAWCVWRYAKPLWGKKRGAFSEVRSREETKGPAVEHGQGEWSEVEKLRAWYVGAVKKELEETARVTRSKDKEGDASQS